jgi:hypothetical protein
LIPIHACVDQVIQLALYIPSYSGSPTDFMCFGRLAPRLAALKLPLWLWPESIVQARILGVTVHQRPDDQPHDPGVRLLSDVPISGMSFVTTQRERVVG